MFISHVLDCAVANVTHLPHWPSNPELMQQFLLRILGKVNQCKTLDMYTTRLDVTM